MLLEKQMMTVAQIMRALSAHYQMVTPNVISQIYGIDDGGKLLRRHLRANFAQPTNHQHGANWTFKTDDVTLKSIIEYAHTKWAIDGEWAKKYGTTK